MKVEFQEKQKFTQWWLWLVLIMTASVPFVELFRQLFLAHKFKDNTIVDSSMVIFWVSMAVVIILFFNYEFKN